MGAGCVCSAKLAEPVCLDRTPLPDHLRICDHDYGRCLRSGYSRPADLGVVLWIPGGSDHGLLGAKATRAVWYVASSVIRGGISQR